MVELDDRIRAEIESQISGFGHPSDTLVQATLETFTIGSD